MNKKICLKMSSSNEILEAAINEEWQIARVMSRVLPSDTEMTDEALTLATRLMKEYAMTISQRAAQTCMTDRRNKISSHDILSSVTNCGYTRNRQYLDRLNSHIQQNIKETKSKRRLNSVVRIRGQAVPLFKYYDEGNLKASQAVAAVEASKPAPAPEPEASVATKRAKLA